MELLHLRKAEDVPGSIRRAIFTLGDLLIGGVHGTFSVVADPVGAVFTLAAVPGGPARGVDGS